MSNVHSFITIIDKIIIFLHGFYRINNETIYRFEREEQINIDRLIHDEIVFILKNFDISSNQQVEMSYLLIFLIINRKKGKNEWWKD
jgi:hypothetical protein